MNVEPFSLRLSEPLETAAGTIERREGFVVRLDVDCVEGVEGVEGVERVEGVGEATPLPGWTESVDACREALEGVADRDWSDSERARDAIDPEATPAAAHGVELALLDARARASEVPLHRMLPGGGDASPQRVPVNATVGDGDPETTATTASDAFDAGYGTVKVKVGVRSVAADAERLGAVRDAVGPDVELRADANGAWSREQAHVALDRFADADVAYVEQPLRADDLAGLADLRGGAVGVAVDESLRDHSVRTVLDGDAADVLILKPMVLGGPERATRTARAARRAGADAVVTTSVDAVHARTAAVHVAATLPDPPACGLATADRLADDLAPEPAPVADGAIRVPLGPGNLGGRA